MEESYGGVTIYDSRIIQQMDIVNNIGDEYMRELFELHELLHEQPWEVPCMVEKTNSSRRLLEKNVGLLRRMLEIMRMSLLNLMMTLMRIL